MRNVTEPTIVATQPNPYPTPSEPERFSDWLDASAELDAFWDSAPTWATATANRTVDNVELIWTTGGILTVAPPASVVARFFDGQSTLRELADDLADAAEVDVSGARALVALVTAELVVVGVLEGVVTADPSVTPAPDEPESTEPASPPPEVLAPDVVRVEYGLDPHGNKITTEYLFDGSRRVTSELTYAFGAEDEVARAAERIVAEVEGGTRSAAELVPRDSCLGSKLRNDEDVPLLTLRGGDGRLRSVRCHDAAVCDRLTELAGARLAAADQRGPIEAFVVSPLEGDGPVRIYDHRGARRGRPRTVEEAVRVVDELLGEAEARGGTGANPLVLLSGLVARRGDEALLIARGAVEAYVPRRDLRRQGWSLAAGLSAACDDAHITVPSLLADATRIPFYGLRLVGYPTESSAAGLVPLLVANAAGSTTDASTALDRVIALSRAVYPPVELADITG